MSDHIGVTARKLIVQESIGIHSCQPLMIFSSNLVLEVLIRYYVIKPKTLRAEEDRTKGAARGWRVSAFWPKTSTSDRWLA